jgi:CBS domain-containing protein
MIAAPPTAPAEARPRPPSVQAPRQLIAVRSEARAMVRHGVHAILIVARDTGRPLGWATDSGLLAWLERDLSAISAGQAITEPPHFVEPDAIARVALEALEAPGVTHLLVAPAEGGPAHGVVAALDLVDLVICP